ncbi:MAG: methylmalonyl-CoA mutase [Oscillospiraceae bacterium]|nr:methylmalonyl-CoA mutase [Oscillospiraceae bacterium]
MSELSRQQLIQDELPGLEEIRRRADAISRDWVIGRSPFMDRMGVNSEREYKERCKQQGIIMRHAHIGYNSAKETIAAIQSIYSELEKKGGRLDRFGICLDCQMGVPPELRNQIPKGAGLVFSSPQEWIDVAQAAPVMVHFGDNMIGTLNTLDNLKCAFAAGGTTIGNASHFYTYEYPFAYDLNQRTIDAVTGFSIMAAFREKGMLVHSNLDDGYAAMFHDLSVTLGWAKLERHIVQELIGAKLGHCFGNLFSNPLLRMTFALALDDINEGDSCGSMVYGNTTDFDMDFSKNYSVINSYLLGDMIAQIHRPTGHGLNAVPVSEAARIPSPQEIVDAQVMSNVLEQYARSYEPYMNWDKLEADKNRLLVGAQVFYDRTLEGLDAMGIDVENPAELMLSLKKLGPAYLEEHFGAGKKADAMRGRIPVWPTDMVKNIGRIRERSLQQLSPEASLTGVKVVVCSTDVHEFGKEIVASILREVGATVYDIGTDASPTEIAETVIETDSRFVAVSTYNGIALTFGRRMLEAFEQHNLKVSAFMGGLLNENAEDGSLPEDVTEDIKRLGILCSGTAENMVSMIKEILDET